ncbi:putative ribosomal protein L11 methyltransferase [Lupinus albus]|uniref:ETFB lysine methyltransferase n=1 Tax=Lupinus albus TaxID=3870 RepID=A0A6A4NU45_LUPAL|nr:putative ribosomal protein L11 methyltransferase [Lupinus albus]
MVAWHFFKHLTCTIVTHSPASTTLSLSHSLLRLSPSPFIRCFSSLSFLSAHNKLRKDQWPPHINIHASISSFSTDSSFSAALADQSLPAPVPYSSVFIHCPKHTADMLAEALLCFGASSVSMDQDDDYESTDEICISSIFPDGEDVNMSISHAADSIGLKEIPRYEVKINEDNEWMKKSQESFHPVEVTEGIWIVPKWITPPDAQATNIILNPGLAFGTGEHPTTKLCLLLLHSCIKGGEYVLDYGTGTGILAIAALKFGAAVAVGVDVDSQAIASASQNAALNNIGPDKIQLHLVASKTSLSSSDDWKYQNVEGENIYDIETAAHKEKYDVVIANILLNPLLDLADQIISSAKPGAVIGLSGILSEQVEHIIQRYSPFLEGIEVSKMDDWACLSGRKK